MQQSETQRPKTRTINVTTHHICTTQDYLKHFPTLVWNINKWILIWEYWHKINVSFSLINNPELRMADSSAQFTNCLNVLKRYKWLSQGWTTRSKIKYLINFFWSLVTESFYSTIHSNIQKMNILRHTKNSKHW